MQNIESILQSYWELSGDAFLFFGFPAAILFMIAVTLENPILNNLRSLYIIRKYDALIHTKETRFNIWCVALYNNRTTGYDFIVNTFKLSSYLLAFGFLYLLIGVLGFVSFGVLLGLLIYWLIRSPTLEKRTIRYAESSVEGGILEEQV